MKAEVSLRVIAPSIRAPSLVRPERDRLPVLTLFFSALAHDAPRIFVVSHAQEPNVPDMVRIRPFEKFEIRHEFGPYPDALLHLRGSESFAPSPAPRLGKISERARICDEGFEKCEYSTPRRRHVRARHI